MEQQQSNGKGQANRHISEMSPIYSAVSDPKQGHPAMLQEDVRVMAGDHRISLGNCCCAGPVRDRHGRRFTTFPRGGRGRIGLAE